MSYSSTEAEVISLDAGLRIEGFLRYHCGILWLTWYNIFASRASGDHKSKTSQTTEETIDHVPPKAQESTNRVFLFLEEKEAVIKMIIKGSSPHMRHVSRLHGVDLDWLMQYANTTPRVADMLTKGSFFTAAPDTTETIFWSDDTSNTRLKSFFDSWLSRRKQVGTC